METVTIHRVIEGKIVEARHTANTAGFWQQRLQRERIERARIEQELQVARSIQQASLPKEAQGLRKLFVRLLRRQTGGMVPGIFQVLMPDLQVAIPTCWLYGYLNERKGSPLSKVQREMIATVVNGLIGGAP
jgi:hypothetical protein